MSDYERVLADLPDDWTTATIEELGSVVSGGTPSREMANYWGGTIPWVTPGEVTTLKEKTLRLTHESITHEGLRQSGANRLPAGSLLVTTRASLGYCAINSVPVTTNQGFKSIVFRQSSNPDFYYHWTREIGSELKRRASGTTFLEISGSDFKHIKLPVPPSAEQQKIAQILDTLDTQIQKTEALIAKLEKIKEGLLHDLLIRGVDQNGQLRATQEQAPELYEEGPLGNIPKNWATATLQEISSVIIDGTHYTPTYMESGVPFLRVTNLHHRNINHSKFKYISEREHKILSARCNPKLGDILLSKNGTVGIAKMVSWSWEFSIFVSLALIRLKDDSGITPQFAELVINSPIVARQIAIQSKQGTVTNLHLEEIRKFVIPIPGLEEQQYIVRELNKISTRIDKETDQREKLLSMKQGLTGDLLSGKVRTISMLKDAV